MSSLFDDPWTYTSRVSKRLTRALKPVFVAILFFASAFAQQQDRQFHASEGRIDPDRTTTALTSKTNPQVVRDYVIGSDDVLWISVWKEPELSQQVLVRSDGKISLPLIGDVQGAGNTTQQLQATLTDKLKDFVASPMVTIVVREAKSHSFNVLGQVEKPGAYPLDKTTTVLDSVALAGGFREWAKVKRIYVLRRHSDGSTVRIPFNYKNAIQGTGDFEIQTRDTIVVP